MQIRSQRTSLSGHITVPGSKSHTIRALLLAALAEGTSTIRNPLPSADCISAGNAIPLLGARIDFNGTEAPLWTVRGAGKGLHLPDDVIDVGNSGSLLYFLSPVAATLEGWSVFTGDESIRRRPVHHVVDVLRQLGAQAHVSRPGASTCPLLVRGAVCGSKKIITEGSVSSQYISGLMLAGIRLGGTLEIELTDPKETPYLTMTQDWIESVGVPVEVSADYRHIRVQSVEKISAFDRTIPSDWEAVAFPLIAALITDSSIVIDNIDGGRTQGDQAIVSVLQSVGADIVWNKSTATLAVRGSRLSAELLPQKTLHVNLSAYPDAVCALAAVACFIEGTTVIEDIAVCRRKETDRIAVLSAELTKLGAQVEQGEDYLVIHGHSPLTAEGGANPAFALHGATVESHSDHRVAMALACMGLGLPSGQTLTVRDAECCAVSFPHFYDVMNGIGAGFSE